MEAAVTLEQVLSRLAREGELYERLPEGRLRCYACGHRCLIPPGHKGICKVRWNEDGRLMVPAGYVAGLQLDPIEKKPFFHAFPGARALSFGMLGCDLHCAYCFTGETPVLTSAGPVPIRALFDSAGTSPDDPDGEIRVPQDLRVISASGEPRRVLKVFRHVYDGALSLVKPMYLPAVRCTPDHRWLATTEPSRGAIEEVAAKNLTPRHFLVVPKPTPRGEPITVDVAGLIRDETATFSIPRSLSPDEVEALMLASAEGESSRSIGARLGRNASYIRHVRSKVRRGRWVYAKTQGRRELRQFSVVWYRKGSRRRRLCEGERHFLVPVSSVGTIEHFSGEVFNLEVEAEHSYVAGLCAVKNCQNALTSQALRDPAMGVPPQETTPREIADLAVRHRARVLTSTYNEPLITSEWAVEVFREGKARGLVCSYVSNGNATAEVLDYIRPWVDLYKVDLKSFDDRHYRQLGGLLGTILEGIRMIHARGFWLEIVTLVVPGFNDSEAELRDIARFLASISPDIPWHVTAFHRDYKMTDRPDTTAQTLLRAAEIGVAEGLRFVYAGNVPGRVGPFENTYCPRCRALLVERVGYTILQDLLTPGRGICPECSTRIPGVWE
jgi:pyruvate formate lyase activating enzyme